ncbi:MAG: hypothetical protein QXL01_04870, partial [Thermoplasmatales archaeon]
AFFFLLLQQDKRLVDLFLFVVAIFGLFNGKPHIAQPFIFSGSVLSILPPHFSVSWFQVLGLFQLIRGLGWKITRANLLVFTAFSALSNASFGGYDLSITAGLALLYVISVYRTPWTVLTLPLIFWFYKPFFLPGVYIFLIRRYRLSTGIKLALMLGLLFCQYSFIKGDFTIERLVDLYGVLFPMLMLFIQSGNVRFGVPIFGFVSSEHLFMFAKPVFNLRTKWWILILFLAQGYIASRTMERVVLENDRIGIVTTISCKLVREHQTDVCKNFLVLWDQGRRVCLQNKPFQIVTDCQGRDWIPLIGLVTLNSHPTIVSLDRAAKSE